MYKHQEQQLKSITDDSELILGCKYLAPWQSKGANSLVLVDFKVRGKTEPKIKSVKLMSRSSKKTFWTTKNKLLFVDSISNNNRAKAIKNLNQSKHLPTKVGNYQDVIDGSLWYVINTSDEGRPEIKAVEDGHIKSKSLGNFLGEYHYVGENYAE